MAVQEETLGCVRVGSRLGCDYASGIRYDPTCASPAGSPWVYQRDPLLHRGVSRFPQVSYQRLKSFGNHPSESSGPNPNWLIYGSDGYLYGTTTTAAYKLKADGTEFRVLHLFTGVAGDGGIPVVGLVEATNGSLYGTTSSGGTG